ncbi:hypothetical protein [Carnimonas bestiolae]|uniref:hypothetical protein n=1 Tax=Carnimonas bestiolae TaxID=3402172 RepID=UPI003F4A89FA
MMDQVIAKVKRKRKNQHFKLISDVVLFDALNIDLNTCTPYIPDHNLDEDSWFKIEQFNERHFCIDLLKEDFDSKEFDDLTKNQFSQIAYLVSVQGDDFYFQKITPSQFIKRKIVAFGEAVKLEENKDRLIIQQTPDAVYFKASDTLIFRNLAGISSIFQGIDELYREATNDEVQQFLTESFVGLDNGYGMENVSKPNRRRIGLAMATLQSMSATDKAKLPDYIKDYCGQRLTFDTQNKEFKISTDNELKILLYGIEQRYYTTPFSQEKRLANSIQALG